MTENFSLSIFTIEADLKPIYAFAAKWQRDAEEFFRNERLRAKLYSAKSSGEPLCDNYTILRFRLANAEERTAFLEKLAANPTEDLAGIFLADVDEH